MAKLEKVRDGYLGDLPENLQKRVMEVHKIIKKNIDEMIDQPAYDDLTKSSWAMSCIDEFSVMPKDKTDIGSFRVYRDGKKKYRTMVQVTGHFTNHRYGWIEELLHDFMCNVFAASRPTVRKKFDNAMVNEADHGDSYEGFDLYFTNKESMELWNKMEGRTTKAIKEDTEFEDDFEEDTDFGDIQELDEKSHGKLKNDFRAAIDIDTGHPIKIVYELDNAQFHAPESHEGGGRRDKATYMDTIQHDIRKYGDTDHKSSNQKVLAIVDVMTGQRLQRSRCIGIFTFEVRDRNFDITNNPHELQKFIKDNNIQIYNVEVGKVDPEATYKSTHWTSAATARNYDKLVKRDFSTSSSANKTVRNDVFTRQFAPKDKRRGVKAGDPQLQVSYRLETLKNHIIYLQDTAKQVNDKYDGLLRYLDPQNDRDKPMVDHYNQMRNSELRQINDAIATTEKQLNDLRVAVASSDFKAKANDIRYRSTDDDIMMQKLTSISDTLQLRIKECDRDIQDFQGKSDQTWVQRSQKLKAETEKELKSIQQQIAKLKGSRSTLTTEQTDLLIESAQMSPEYKEAKSTLRTIGQRLINDVAASKGFKMSQYNANLIGNIITRDLLPVWAGGYRKLSITLTDYSGSSTLEFKVPKMTQDFVARFVVGRESMNGFLHRQPEIKIKMSPRIFHQIKSPDDLYNFFKSAVIYYDTKVEKAAQKLMHEAMKLNHTMKQLVGSTSLCGIVTYPLSLLFIFDDVQITSKTVFELSQTDVNAVSKFIKNIPSKYAAPAKEKKKIVDDIKEVVKVLRESCDDNETVNSLRNFHEEVSAWYFDNKYADMMQDINDRWIDEQVDYDGMRKTPDPQAKYLREAFGVKKLKKIPRDLIAYIQIETEAIKDANDKMMISSYCLSKLEIVEWYIELIDVGTKKYIVPHPRSYLEAIRTQLLACHKKIMETPIPKADRPLIDIRYPAGYEG